MIPHNRKIAVLGLGYVGLPVAVAFSKFGKVIGFDINETRIAKLKQGIDETLEVSKQQLSFADIVFTSKLDTLAEADFYIAAVPTPVDESKRPDLSLLMHATSLLGSVIKKEDIVVYESTVYPGATEEECIPLLESKSGLAAGTDFQVGYSPERINPGDENHNFSTIKKVVSAQQKETLDIIADVYGAVITAGVFKAASIKVAEAAKVIENTQRDLNIALMNELAVIFDKMDIDTGDVLKAAATKWNFLPFKPGLVGGHCIGVDPYYLTYKAESIGYTPEVILAGRRINDGMAEYISSLVIKNLTENDVDISASIVTILGITFKENVPDIRNSKTIDIVQLLRAEGVLVQVYDPLASKEDIHEIYGVNLLEKQALVPSDITVIAVAHTEFEEQGWEGILPLLNQNKGVVIDVQRILERSATPGNVKLVRL